MISISPKDGQAYERCANRAKEAQVANDDYIINEEASGAVSSPSLTPQRRSALR